MNNDGVILVNPKFAHNVGSAVRNAAAFGHDKVYWTGSRVSLDVAKGERLPREERMRVYTDDVQMIPTDRPFDLLPDGVVPVAIELMESSEQLHEFEHPERAVYVFGPEDGSIPKQIKVLCHRFVVIPTYHCLNLSVAMGLVLGHRRMQMIERGLEPRLSTNSMLKEDRGPS